MPLIFSCTRLCIQAQCNFASWSTSKLRACAVAELASVDLTLHVALFVHLYLADMSHFAAANAAYCRHFPAVSPSSRACVEVPLPPGCPLMLEVLLPTTAAGEHIALWTMSTHRWVTLHFAITWLPDAFLWMFLLGGVSLQLCYRSIGCSCSGVWQSCTVLGKGRRHAGALTLCMA